MPKNMPKNMPKQKLVDFCPPRQGKITRPKTCPKTCPKSATKHLAKNTPKDKLVSKTIKPSEAFVNKNWSNKLGVFFAA